MIIFMSFQNGFFIICSIQQEQQQKLIKWKE
jgi:hypothetical protein